MKLLKISRDQPPLTIEYHHCLEANLKHVQPSTSSTHDKNTAHVLGRKWLWQNRGLQPSLNRWCLKSQNPLQSQPQKKLKAQLISTTTNPQLESLGLPAEWEIPQSHLSNHVGGNQNVGVHFFHLDEKTKQFVIKLKPNLHKARQEAEYASWLSQTGIGPDFLGVYEVTKDGKISYGLVSRKADGINVKLSSQLSVAVLNLVAKFWNQNSWNDWQRIIETFENSDIQPRDVELLIGQDGHLLIIDPSMFTRLDPSWNVSKQVRLRALYDWNAKIRLLDVPK